MRQKDKIREKLLAVYKALSPLDQALVQLCSVVYEPTDVATLFKCFRGTGLVFPQQSIAGTGELEQHLIKLQNLKLLNKSLQCHDAIVEICSRDALAIAVGSKLGDDLQRLEETAAWAGDFPSGAVCYSCRSPISEPAFQAPAGLLCASCAQTELKAATAAEDFSEWSVAQFNEALSGEATLRSRLTVLWRFSEVYPIVSRYTVAAVDGFLDLLVRNLGYDSPHPLARAVRQAAVDACIGLGKRILPHLLKMFGQEPWQFHANVSMVLATIAPAHKDVRPLLQEAATDANPEVRKRVLIGLGNAGTIWAHALIVKLCHDPHPEVRAVAKTVAKQTRPKPAKTRPAPGVSSKASNYYQLMAKAVQTEMPPISWHYSGTLAKHCQRTLRDLRIGLYTRNTSLLQRSYERIHADCSAIYGEPPPLVRICNNPFDPSWFRTLSMDLQVFTLPDIFHHARFSLVADDEALAYALDVQFRAALSRSEQPAFYHHLISRLLVGGRLTEAGELLAEMQKTALLYGLKGWMLFLQGKNDSAIAAFESDLKELRRNVGKRNAYFGGLEGLFFILALLQSEETGAFKKIDDLLDAALARHGEGSSLAPSYRALKAVVHSLKGEADKARALLADCEKSAGGWDTFFWLLAAYWNNGELLQKEIDTLSEVFIKSREVDLNWLAMECAELLCRADEHTPVRRNTSDKIRQETGIQSFVATIRVEEPWRRSLRALVQVAAGSIDAAAEPRDKRLIWLLDHAHGLLSLQPLEQKRGAAGAWTKGRAVALSRLFGGKKPDCLTPQDHAVCAAIEREGRYYYNTQYRFNLTKVLPALVGHPLLFLEKSPGVSVEVVKAGPEVLVTREEKGILVRFSMENPESRLLLVQETPTRFKVVELTDEQLRIARVLGTNGLTVPASATQEVMEAVAGISSHVTVHSAIGGISKDIQEVAADARPRVQILPSGSGFRLEMFVQPFGQSGPYLKPGSGMENVISEIDGRLLHTRRDLHLEEKMAAAAEAACPTLVMAAESDRQWQLDDPQDCLQVLLDLKTLQDEGQVVLGWPEGERIKVTREISFDRLRLRIRSKTDWFEVDGELQVDDHLVLDMKRLLELLETTKTRFIPLQEGQFLALTQELRKRLLDLEVYAEKHGKELRLHPLAALAVEDFTDQLPHVEADRGWKTRLTHMRSGLQLEPEVPSTFKAELRDYQVEGYRWLARLAHLGLGGCLADDMGLGKTLQALAIMLQRAPAGPSLVVAPTSVCMNWVSEANRFAPTLNITVLGSGNREQLVGKLGGMDVLVASYGLLYQEAELLASVPWRTIVLDEAQAIKNVAAKRSQAAMNLQGAFRLITTGTPIENHLGEFWTLFNFINPGLLGSQQRFNERFAIPIERNSDREARKRLKKLIQPFILRRTKAQVLEELPPRTEVLLQVEMSAEESAFYEALRRQALEKLERDDSPVGQKHLKILAEIMRLRQACCHPRLVAPETSISGSKLELFGEVVSELLENRHKALVFSQFVGHLKLLREYLDARKMDYRYLDGSTPPRERKRQVDAFQAGHGDLFLISLKAGGLGLNLTAADYVIHMDPWWNPAVEDQASDRAHRIGQQRPVTVYRLVTQNTIEEKIVKLHHAKRDLASSLLDGSDMTGKMSVEELLKLISEQ